MKHYPRRGFTMVEMLTVIGIIVVLIAILLPVIAKVRVQALVASTQAEINTLAASIEKYRADQGAYPGPIPNSAFANGTAAGFNDSTGKPITMTENMVLGLCGGWDPPVSGTGSATYVEASVGLGPMMHTTVLSKRRRYAPYIDPQPGVMTPPMTWSQGTGKTGISDSNVPEFMDRMPDPDRNNALLVGNPIVYIRANVGNPGIVSTDNSTQYNVTMLSPYFPYTNTTTPGKGISTTDYPSPTGNSSAAAGYQAYFAHPTIAGAPRAKDAYLLISAGPDDVYGTKDDIFNVTQQ